MKRIYIIIIAIIVVGVVFNSYRGMVLAASQSGNTMPQLDDLCGGTGGNGQIVNVEKNTFTLERNDGRNLIVKLTDRTTIKTPHGNISVSDLEIGDRVTLVGDNNRNGTFNADAVVICSVTQKNETGQATPLSVRKENTNSKNVSGAINAAMLVLFGLIWFGLALFLRLKKKKSLVYLLLFTIFYVYLYKVLDYTILQFQSLLLLQHFVPDLMLRGVAAGKSVNLIPLFTLTSEDVITSFLNILLMMPFGFGLPFITSYRMKKVVVIGLLLSIFIELLQLITGFMANTTFRIADINDLLFNTVGVAIGYFLFSGFVRYYRHISHDWKISANPLLRYIAERPQIKKHQATTV
jgi:glycopeptide antibiotics resistance protein